MFIIVYVCTIEIIKEMTRNKLYSESNKTFIIKDNMAAFVHYFSSLDSKGLASVLKNDVVYDELSKQDWIVLFEKLFESFRSHNIHYLNPISGICLGCKNGCSGYTFLDEVGGFYVDFVIEVNEQGIFDFTECLHLKNEIKVADKKEQIFIKQIPYLDTDEVPF